MGIERIERNKSNHQGQNKGYDGQKNKLLI